VVAVVCAVPAGGARSLAVRAGSSGPLRSHQQVVDCSSVMIAWAAGFVVLPRGPKISPDTLWGHPSIRRLLLWRGGHAARGTCWQGSNARHTVDYGETRDEFGVLRGAVGDDVITDPLTGRLGSPSRVHAIEKMVAASRDSGIRTCDPLTPRHASATSQRGHWRVVAGEGTHG
jgi:hypothetical protein